MKLQKHKFIIPSFLVGFILLAPLSGFTQDTGWQLNQKGNWVKIGQGLGISYGGVGNKSIAAANPNSLVTMRQKDDNGEPFLSILKSTDKGNSWQTLYKDTNDWTTGYDVDHPTKNVIGWLQRKGYGSSPGRAFKYTTDGGKTFETVEHRIGGGIVKGDVAINISMYNAKHWAFTTHDDFSLKDHTYLYITHDGGQTWEEKHFKVPKRKLGTYQVVMRSPKKVSLFPKHNGDAKSRISTDGGKTWETYSQMPNKATGWKHSIAFPTPDTGYVGGVFHRGRDGADTGKIFKTTDGGRSWDLILNTLLPVPIGGIRSIDFISKKEGLVTGFWTENMLRTKDGGKTWLRDSLVYDMPPAGWDVIYTEKDREKLALGLVKGRGDVWRFKVTDSTANTTGKEQVSDQEQGLSIYPNPSDGAFRIRWQGQEAVAGTLYNMQGQAVRSFQLAPQQEATYSLSGIQTGTYIFKVNGRNIAKKVLIKQE